MRKTAVFSAMAAAAMLTSARPYDDDVDLLDDILANEPETFLNPFREAPNFDMPSRAESRSLQRNFGSGGKAYAMDKGRSKDARKARRITRQKRK